MKIVSWNVNGLKSIINKNDSFVNLVNKEKPDILCLQETRCTKESFGSLHEHFKNFPFVYLNETKGKKGHSGVLIASVYEPLSVQEDFPFLDEKENIHEGRVITLEFDDYFLVNVYVPNSGSRFKFRVEEWDFKFKDHILKLQQKGTSNEHKQSKDILIVGDLNCIIDCKADEPGRKIPGASREEIGNFQTLLKECSLTDCFRTMYQGEKGYTWFAPWQKKMGLRLDYCLVSSYLIDNFDHVKVLEKYHGSDHRPLMITLKE